MGELITRGTVEKMTQVRKRIQEREVAYRVESGGSNNIEVFPLHSFALGQRSINLLFVFCWFGRIPRKSPRPWN